MNPKTNPKRFRINKEDRAAYEKLRKTEGPLKGLSNPELFVLAVVLGYKSNAYVELDSHEPFIHDYNLSDEQTSIIWAVAVAKKKSLEAWLDYDEVIKIAEEYASAGLPLLEKMANSADPDFFSILETELVDYFDKEQMGRIK